MANIRERTLSSMEELHAVLTLLDALLEGIRIDTTTDRISLTPDAEDAARLLLLKREAALPKAPTP